MQQKMYTRLTRKCLNCGSKCSILYVLRCRHLCCTVCVLSLKICVRKHCRNAPGKTNRGGRCLTYKEITYVRLFRKCSGCKLKGHKFSATSSGRVYCDDCVTTYNRGGPLSKNEEFWTDDDKPKNLELWYFWSETWCRGLPHHKVQPFS